MHRIQRIRAEDTWALRRDVMWPEKDLSFVQLPDDKQGIHYGLFIENQIVSVASLMVSDRSAQFRKFATRQSHQGKGYGSLLLDHILKDASSMNLDKVWCNARSDAKSLYLRFGFVSSHTIFEKEGIQFEVMTRQLL